MDCTRFGRGRGARRYSRFRAVGRHPVGLEGGPFLLFVHMDGTPCGGSPFGEQEGRLQRSDSLGLRACDRYFAIRALGGHDTTSRGFPRGPYPNRRRF